MERHPVQIVVVPETDLQKGVLLALANDGTLWGKYVENEKFSPWVKLPDLPQPEKTDV